MSQEPLLTTEQLAEALKIPETLILSFRDQGLLPPVAASPEADSSEPRYMRSDVVRSLRQHPEAMDAIRQAMRQS
ncbi:MAG: helix-turn-helix domain-containing protein [Planctomycetales bacterium]